MAAPRGSNTQARFWLGELRPEVSARTDPEITRHGLRKARNVRIVQSGQAKRRPGTVFDRDIGTQYDTYEYEASDGTRLVLVFTNAKMEAFRKTDNAPMGEVTGAPWTTAMLGSLSFAADGDTVYVAHQDMQPQTLVFDPDTTSWTRAAFAFDAGPSDSKLQPYYKFDDVKDITLAVGAYEGTGVSLTASADFFTSDHVGVRIRYAFREIEIKTVTDGQNATGDVVIQLPPSYDMQVTDSRGFRVGEVVIGADSGVQGRLLDVDEGTWGSGGVRVLILDGYEGPVNTEELDGPNHTTSVTTVPSKVVTPPATTVWDEAFMSDARGWPGYVGVFRSRLILADFAQLPGAVFVSAAGVLTDGNVEEGNADSAILDILKDQENNRIRYAMGAENLLILTPKKVFYVPDDPNTGTITPSTFGFRQVARVGANATTPIEFANGVVFVDEGGNRIMQVFPTGNRSQPWDVRDISSDHAHLISGPVSLAATEGNSESPERYVYAVNDDGTIAVMFTRVAPGGGEIIGWVLWNTEGTWKAVMSVDGVIYCSITRDAHRTLTTSDDEDFQTSDGELLILGDADSKWFLEHFDNDRLMDSSAPSLDATAREELVTSDGENIETSDGENIVLSNRTILHLADAVVAVVENNNDYGDWRVGTDGFIDDPALDGVAYDAGLNFTVTVGPYWHDNPDRKNPGTKRTAAGRIVVDFYETVGARVFDRILPRQDWKSLHLDPQPKTAQVTARKLGHRFTHEYDDVIVQDRPGALTIRSISIQN